MPELQISKRDITQHRLLEGFVGDSDLTSGQIRVKIDRFGFSANNITYAAMGDRLGYWQFFPPKDDDGQNWGVIPIWGFADVVESSTDEIAVGERLFGYFPPADHLILSPVRIAKGHFLDGSEHRSKLPAGYNLYRRVEAELGYSRAMDNHRMLLYPLYLTSFSLWDLLQQNEWYGASQIILLSASSKTSIGLAQALHDDPKAPPVLGATSSGNKSFVESLGLYQSCLTYDGLTALDASIPTAIVDMAGNAAVAGQLHKHLGDNMRYSVNVGLTHWDVERGDANINRERSEMFFAPSHIQNRMKEWGADVFDQRSSAFILDAAAKSSQWLTLKKMQGLDELAAIYSDICDGKNPPNEGLIIEMP